MQISAYSNRNLENRFLGMRVQGSLAQRDTGREAGALDNLLPKVAAPKKQEIGKLQKVFESVIKYAFKELGALAATELGELVIGWVRKFLSPEENQTAKNVAVGNVAVAEGV